MLQPAEHQPTQHNSSAEVVEPDPEQAHNRKLQALSAEDHDPTWIDSSSARDGKPRSVYQGYNPSNEFTYSGRSQPRQVAGREPRQLATLRRLTGLILKHENSSAPLARHLYEEHWEPPKRERGVTTLQLEELSEQIGKLTLFLERDRKRPLIPAQKILLEWTVHGAMDGAQRRVPRPLANLLDEKPQLDRAAAGKAMRHALARLYARDLEEERRILGSND